MWSIGFFLVATAGCNCLQGTAVGTAAERKGPEVSKEE